MPRTPFFFAFFFTLP
ncbi:TPA: hypothetical protein ACKQE3_000775 [Serratia marcescens]|nr:MULTISPECIES: hypothetical protein [Serratia]MBN5268089.1 hypothetical protein [Serratia ureilytica]MBN5344436.1 hypothetical protein [Serratia marcescens]